MLCSFFRYDLIGLESPLEPKLKFDDSSLFDHKLAQKWSRFHNQLIQIAVVRDTSGSVEE